MSFLKEIVALKKAEVKQLKEQRNDLENGLQQTEKGQLLHALSKDPVSVIAEIKKASPSVGVLKKDLDVEKMAIIYNENGANAISVLTETKYFQGDLANIALVKKHSKLPVLRKDFIIHPLQVLESRKHNADAILLIASILSVSEIKELAKTAAGLGMDCLLEIHNEDDLKKALKTDLELIGINNRDLVSLQIDLNTSLKLHPKIPADRKIVVESGITSLKDIHLFVECGLTRFLIGQFLVSHGNPGEMLKAIRQIQPRKRTVK